MKAVVHHRYGPPHVLQLADVPRPLPATGEVLIRSKAISVTAVDCSVRAGGFFARLSTGLRHPRRPVLGVGAAGVVEAVGAGVRQFRPGERVVAASGVEMGGYAEFQCWSQESVSPVPDGMSFDEAVAVTDGGLTALPILRDHAKLNAGQHVLVNGASGAVGTAAVLLAKHFGAVVTGVCSSDNVELVRSLGADEVIDYTEQDFTDRPESYDVIVDAVGKSSFRRCRTALRAGGIYLTPVPSLPMIWRAQWTRWFGDRRAVLARTERRRGAAKAADMALLTALAASGEVPAVIDRRWPLAEAVEAHRYVDRGRKRGVVLLTVGG